VAGRGEKQSCQQQEIPHELFPTNFFKHKVDWLCHRSRKEMEAPCDTFDFDPKLLKEEFPNSPILSIISK
jgi:hypothetical protein